MKKKYFLLFILFFSINAISEDINLYKYYQTDQIIPKRKTPHYIVYIKNNDPCIYAYNIKNNEETRFCEMGNTGLNLERDYPTIYPVNLTLRLGVFSFTVAAPWNEQKCEIFLPKNRLTCEPTGK